MQPELSDLSPHAFVQKYGIKTESGLPLDFRDHLFWFDVLSDNSPKQVWYKAAQMGGSTIAIIKTLWTMRRYGMDAIYTLPTSNDVRDFVSGKVNRIIAANPVLQQWVQDKDSVEQKRVCNNVVYYRGTWTERAAIMVSSDLNVYDEEDRSKGDIIQQYASRLQHSKYKWEWHFSNPSVEGNGVSRYWAQSDQKHWFIKCHHCNHQQYLSFPESIDLENPRFICKKCRGELSREDRRIGQWKAKYPERTEYSGYWFSLLMAPWVTAEQIVHDYNHKSKEYFWNFVLGLPYVGEGNTITKSILMRNCSDDQSIKDGRVIIGCDSGIKKHYVCGTESGLFRYGVTEAWDDIRGLLRQYRRSVAIIDAMPDITEPRKLRDEFPGRVYLCHYARDRKTLQLVRWGQNDEEGSVLADRNRMIQKVIDEFSNMDIPLLGTQDDWERYWSHWKTMYRLQDTDVLGTPTFTWESSDGNDHWAHATVYYRIGLDRFGQGEGTTFIPSTLPEHRGPVYNDNGTVTMPSVKAMLAKEKKKDWRL